MELDFVTIHRNPTHRVQVGSIAFGAGEPIAVQSMTATRTQDTGATIDQIRQLRDAGADIVRVAVDSRRDVEALARIRGEMDANLSVDLQENYRLAERVAPHVDKIRYNPGHLYHHEPEKAWRDKVKYLVDVAATHACAVRVGVNCGSVDPEKRAKFPAEDRVGPMLESALEHVDLLDELGFEPYCVSLKDSDPRLVVQVNQRFAQQRPDIPLHLGVTEAGMPPAGVTKTRMALEPLLTQGIGDTVRVSLTVPNPEKWREIRAARAIIEDVRAGRSGIDELLTALNIISCPSCSRVENEAFVQLAKQIEN